jgi:class III poly(R)-hydroxyalkanoic acid synthase PhaE subunit
VTPFEYMQALAEMWGRGGKEFAALQQSFLSGFPAAPQSGMFDAQGLVQANQAFAKMWSSAMQVSQTISRNMRGGEKQDPILAEMLAKIFDPRAWFAGTESMDQALQKMAEGPRLADLWNTEQKMLALFNAWSALRRRSLEHNTVMLQAWIAAAGKFAQELNARADRKERVETWRDMLALWVETANNVLLETQRSETYLKSQREILKASVELRLAQQNLADLYSEVFGYPTRQELDDVHRAVTELRRELRASMRGGRSRSDGGARSELPEKRPPEQDHSDRNAAS